jgi:uncharacterized Zn-finger protein
MATIDAVSVKSKKISCNGGEGSSAHPLIYLDMGDKNNITCPYCSKNFVFKQKLGQKSKK